MRFAPCSPAYQEYRSVGMWKKSIPDFSSAKPLSKKFNSIVVGAGPAGLAVTSTLMDVGSVPILWVDPAFSAGRLLKYLEVPSNTKTKLFAQYAMMPIHTADKAPWALQCMQDQDPERGCNLGLAQEMVERLTQGLHDGHKDKVCLQRGLVNNITQEGSVWNINNGKAFADRVFLVTGAHPKDQSPYPGLVTLDLDDALIPSRLSGLVSREDKVCVIGSSHSAVLVLMNLLEMENGPKVLNLYRSQMKYAEYLPDGTIIRDNTGLKGIAAEWAREKIDSGHFVKCGQLQRINTTEQDPADEVATCTKIVSAVGYGRNPLPDISMDGKALQNISHDPKSGVIIPGKLYGFGIAFPEEIIDPKYGHKEPNVGMLKFMKFAQKVLPA